LNGQLPLQLFLLRAGALQDVPAASEIYFDARQLRLDVRALCPQSIYLLHEFIGLVDHHFGTMMRRLAVLDVQRARQSLYEVLSKYALDI